MKQSKSSIRWSLFAIALLPALAVGLAWLAATTFFQARDIRDSLLMGAIQSAGVYSQNIVDQMQGGATNLSNPGFINKIQARLTELFAFKLMPLQFAAVANAKGQVIAAFDARNLEEAGSVLNFVSPFDAWKRLNPDATEQISTFALSALKYKTPLNNSQFSSSPDPLLTKKIRVNQQDLTLIAYPMVGAFGITVMALDMTPIEARVNQASLTALLALLVALILAGLVASLFANRIGQRLGALVLSADQISQCDNSQIIADKSNDEIGQLGQAIERLRVSINILMSRQSKRS